MKNKVLLLGHNNWQVRSLTLTLRLGGYLPWIVRDAHEAINAVNTMPDEVLSVVLSGNIEKFSLKEMLSELSDFEFSAEVIVVGLSSQDIKNCKDKVPEYKLKMSCCSNDQLLEYLDD